jgi:hypothetical protein
VCTRCGWQLTLKQTELEELEEQKHALCAQLYQIARNTNQEKERRMMEVWMSLAAPTESR